LGPLRDRPCHRGRGGGDAHRPGRGRGGQAGGAADRRCGRPGGARALSRAPAGGISSDTTILWRFGSDAYPGLDAKAAALLHSLARNHALIDGNRRLALAATIAFYGVNGRRLTLTNDEAYVLIMAVAEGKLDSVDDIAAVLATATKPRL
jgi:prophage maintenance system killer protein